MFIIIFFCWLLLPLFYDFFKLHLFNTVCVYIIKKKEKTTKNNSNKLHFFPIINMEKKSESLAEISTNTAAAIAVV